MYVFMFVGVRIKTNRIECPAWPGECRVIWSRKLLKVGICDCNNFSTSRTLVGVECPYFSHSSLSKSYCNVLMLYFVPVFISLSSPLTSSSLSSLPPQTSEQRQKKISRFMTTILLIFDFSFCFNCFSSFLQCFSPFSLVSFRSINTFSCCFSIQPQYHHWNHPSSTKQHHDQHHHHHHPVCLSQLLPC